MNKYQKKLNKLTKIQVDKDIEEKFSMTNEVKISIYDILASSFNFGHMLHKINKSFEYNVMNSKGYYRWTRKCIRRKIKKGCIEI